MSVITFVNNLDEETGKTMSFVAIATYMAIHNNNKILIISTTNKEDKIKNKYYYDLSSIIDDYLNKLNNTINTCISNILISFKDMNIEFFDTIMTPYKIPTEKISKVMVGRTL